MVTCNMAAKRAQKENGAPSGFVLGRPLDIALVMWPEDGACGVLLYGCWSRVFWVGEFYGIVKTGLKRSPMAPKKLEILCRGVFKKGWGPYTVWWYQMENNVGPK